MSLDPKGRKLRFSESLWGVAFLLCLAPSVSLAGDLAKAQPEAPIVNPVAQQSLADFPATLQRPLFAPTRRKAAAEPPPAAPLKEPPKPAPAPPAVTLIGVIADPEGSQAMLRSEGVKAIRVKVGDEVMGWRVAGIDAQRVTLTLGDRDFSVALFAQRPANSGPVHNGDDASHHPPLIQRDR
jgi:hypothetical protein